VAGSVQLLEVEGVSKAFPSVLANDNVSFDLRHGEIHALLGENGAGKTTLMGMLFGLHRPDAGRILVEGEEVAFTGPRDAISRGFGFVQQHYSLIPTLTVANNIMLGQRYGRVGRIRRAACERKIAQTSARHGLEVDLAARIEDLTVGEQQRVELLKALLDTPKVLILDEPTALLSSAETVELWQTLKGLARSGVGIILIAHKLDEVIAVADRMTVLRRGRKIATVEAADADVASLGALMVGDIGKTQVTARRRRLCGDETAILTLSGVAVPGDRASFAAQEISFEVRGGEILGIGGVVGGGQVELLEAIAGVRPIGNGTIRLDGRDIGSMSIRARQERGVAYVPPDRHRDGLIGPLSIADNLALCASGSPATSRFGILQPKAIAQRAERLIERFDIRSGGRQTPSGQLSGGNQQKVILARELAREPKVILCCYPTRGLDFAATAAVQAELRGAADRGAAVVVVSMDLIELFDLADRMVVMQGGRIRGGGAVGDLTAEKIGLMIGGGAVT
jgi:simple sugar transport system ATP-binding protein